ncbi:MAG: hypothetical protein ACRCUQ_00795 [Alphaproteobacteria bacterium]
MSIRSFLWASIFFIFCFPVAGVLVPPPNLVRLDYFKNIGNFKETWAVKTYRSMDVNDRLVVSTNLPFSFKGIDEFYPSTLRPRFEKKILDIPDVHRDDFLEKILKEFKEIKVLHIIFDNFPWKQLGASFLQKICSPDFSPYLANIKSFNFSHMVIDSNALMKLCSLHPEEIEKLSFVSCFMGSDLLEKIKTSLSGLKELFLSDVGFLKNPVDEKFAEADCIPDNITKLSIFSCYRAIVDVAYIEGDKPAPEESGSVFYISKIDRSLGIEWLAKRTRKFSYLKFFTFSKPEICLEELSSCPIDKIFEMMPELDSFRLSIPRYGDSREFGDDRKDYLRLDQRSGIRCYSFLDGIAEVTWEKVTKLLVFETDDSFLFDDGIVPSLSLSEDKKFFKRNKRSLSDDMKKKAKRNFKSLIEKFPGNYSVVLSQEDSFTPELSSFLREHNIQDIKTSSKSEEFPENIYLACAQRSQLAFNLFENNEKQGTAVYLAELSKNLASTKGLLEEDVKQHFKDGSINKIFKKELLTTENLADYLLKVPGIFLFMVSELEFAGLSLGYYSISSLGDPWYIFFTKPAECPGLPLEFLEFFSTDFNKKPEIDISVISQYLLESQRIARLNVDGIAKNPSERRVYRMVVETFFPAPWQMIPLLKVQRRAELIARAILGLEEESKSGSGGGNGEICASSSRTLCKP